MMIWICAGFILGTACLLACLLMLADIRGWWDLLVVTFFLALSIGLMISSVVSLNLYWMEQEPTRVRIYSGPNPCYRQFQHRSKQAEPGALDNE